VDALKNGGAGGGFICKQNNCRVRPRLAVALELAAPFLSAYTWGWPLPSFFLSRK